MTEHATPQEVPIDFGEERGLERIHPKPAEGAAGVQPAQAPSTDQLVEAVAKAIYRQWVAAPGYVAWVEGGNSLNQDDARRLAREAIENAAATESSTVPAGVAATAKTADGGCNS